MTLLLIGIILFGGSHLFSTLLPAERDRLKTALGEGPWKGLYAAVSLAGIGLMIWGFIAMNGDPAGPASIYVPFGGARHITMLLVLSGFILIGASHGKSHLKALVRNPMSIGVVLWAVGHLLANGKLSDVLLFGTFLAVGLADIVASELRGKRPRHVPALRSDIIAVAVGIVLYLVFLFIVHPYVFGIPVIR